MSESIDAGDLFGKVAEWLSSEGYPLEYHAAHQFRQAGFSVEQGGYVHRDDAEPREIDLLAKMDRRAGEKLLVRAYTVVECKWTKDKPWVAFTSPTSRMASSAIIAHTIASELAEAAVFLDAGNEVLGGLDLFSSPSNPSFGGRKALSNTDVFYNSLRSVTGAARGLVWGYDPLPARGKKFPKYGVVAFPVILIDGLLYEAAFEADSDKLSLNEVAQARLHWRGSPDSRLLTTVDVVTKAGLPAFVAKRAEDTKKVLDELARRCAQLQDWANTGEFDETTVNRASTGISGTPSLLGEIKRKFRYKNV
jgi:hypothetical protein